MPSVTIDIVDCSIGNSDNNYSSIYSEHTYDRVEETSLVIRAYSYSSVDFYSGFYSSGDSPY